MTTTTSSVAPRAETTVSPARLGALGLTAILLAYALPVLNFFSVTVALGSLTDELHASPAVLQLVIAMFGVAYASTVVLGGRLGDNLGRRRVMAAGLGIFLLASLVSAVAASAPTLIVGRVVMGFGAALLAPQVLSTITTALEGRERARAMAFFGANAGIATCVAFIVGGLLVGLDPGGLGWRSIFWLNMPLVVLAMLALPLVPESRSSVPARTDPWGTVLLAVTVVLLVLPLTEGRAAGWPWWTWVMLAACLPAAALFVAWESRLERHGGMPLVPPRVVAQHQMRTGLTITFGFFMVFAGFMFIFGLTAQTTAGMGAIAVGLSLTPFAVAFLVASLVGTNMAHADPRRLMRRGAITSSVGYLLTAVVLALWWPHFTGLELAAPFIIVGFGQGWLVVPLFGAVVSGVPRHQAGVGSGLMLTTMQMAMGIGSAVLGAVYLGLAGLTDGAAPVVVVILVCASGLAGVAALVGRLQPDGRA